MKKISKKIIYFILCLILISPLYVMGLGVEIQRDTPYIDTDKLTSLTILYSNDDVPLSLVKFSVYKVATVSRVFYYTLTKDFANYPIKYNGLRTVDQWRDLATTLDGYVAKDGIKPIIEGLTDDSGILKLSDLETGLYLVVGESKEIGIATYTPESFLVSLPDLNVGNYWDYDVFVEPKFERVDDYSRLFDKKVIKVWDDKGYEQLRPNEINVQLLKDDEVYEEVVLNEDNDWEYVFKNLDNKCNYKIVEQQIDGYTVSVNKEGEIYTITNTYVKPPEVPVIPETGQLWWPVPLLIIVGGCFVFIGFKLDKRKKIKNEKE